MRGDDRCVDRLLRLGGVAALALDIDDELVGVDDIYFQGGDREDLVHMEGEAFFDLMADGKHAPFSVAS